MDIELVITGITPQNRREKLLKAIRAISKGMKIPLKIEKEEERGHETYLYPVQQEISDFWTSYYRDILRKIYKTVCAALGMPETQTETLRKAALKDDFLRYKGGLLRFIPFYRGKIIYNPETGEPLKNKDFDALIEGIQRFLNRETKDLAKQILLDSATIGKLLRRMAKYQTSEALEKQKLEDLKYRGKTFDWIRADYKNLYTALGEPLTRAEQGRYQVARDYVAQLVTRTNEAAKNEIKETVLNGIRERRSKSQVSQDLFNRLGGLNRDWKRIADTEIVNTSNLAGILEEVNNTPDGEKVYFKRYELAGCCPKCAAVNGKVVLWSDTPLADDKIKDEHADTAIWEGKPQERGRTVLVTGTLHPNCRGSWVRWGGGQADAMRAKLEGKIGAWDNAVKQAREEYRKHGVENPNDQTKGYVERINELYRSLL